MKITSIILLWIFSIIPFIHARLWESFHLPVSFLLGGNFEFTKSICFVILCFFLSFVALIEYVWKREHIQIHLSFRHRIILLSLLLILSLSSIVWISPFQSFIGDREKWHTFFVYFGLIGISLLLWLLIHTEKKRILWATLIWLFFVELLAFKEYLFPSFSYGALWERLLWSFGHPNYLAWYILILFPYLFLQRKKDNSLFFRYIQYSFIIFSFLALIFTQSLWAILLLFLFFGIFYCMRKSFKKKFRFLFPFLFLCLIIAISFWVLLFFPEKLHSFLSRWYIWKSIFSLLISNPHYFIFGIGAENLPILFENFQVPELYIFENIGYSVDRAHNLLLDIWLQFWLIWIVIFWYILSIFKKNHFLHSKHLFSLKWAVSWSLLLFLLYGIFHYYSLASYLIIILGISVLSEGGYKKDIKNFWMTLAVWIFFVVSLGFAWFFGGRLWYAEVLAFEGKNQYALQIFPHPHTLIENSEFQKAEMIEWFLSQENIRTQIYKENLSLEEWCMLLWEKFPTPRNAFFCGERYEKKEDRENQEFYYKKALSKLPNLWEKDSPYWKNYFIAQSITGNRFFSEKFSPLREVLQKLDIEIESRW